MRLAVICVLFLLAAPRWLPAVINADGVGYFPLVVIVYTDMGLLLPGATVTLHDAGPPDIASINDREVRHLAASIGQPVETDARGAALLFYYGRWSSHIANGKEASSRQVRGRIVIHAPGFEQVERLVTEVVGSQTTTRSSAPVVGITLKRTPTTKPVPK